MAESPEAVPGAPLDGGTLDAEALRPWVGAAFALRPATGIWAGGPGPGGPDALVLRAVRTHPEATPSWAPRTAFTLLFAGPQAPVLGQGLYDLGHPEAGRLAGVLLVPVINPNGPFDAQTFYQVSFN